MRAKAEALRELDAQLPGRTFLLVPDAGLYYLITGMRNPTPYDYPYVTAFGRNGEAQTAAAIRRGEITKVLIDVVDRRLAAWPLIHSVREQLAFIADIGGVVYGRR